MPGSIILLFRHQIYWIITSYMQDYLWEEGLNREATCYGTLWFGQFGSKGMRLSLKIPLLTSCV